MDKNIILGYMFCWLLEYYASICEKRCGLYGLVAAGADAIYG